MNNPKERNIVLSVCMITYNHEKWIGEAIEGVLKQKTSFPFELVIGDDCSTDATGKIIQSYSEKNPEIIRAFINPENLGMSENFTSLLNNCNGKYIAICEGDDFWTDPNKLQTQFDFLEVNPDCILSSHNFGRLNELTGNLDLTLKYNQNFRFDQKRFIEDWVTQPLSCVFRNIFRDYSFFNKEKDIFCDVILFYELLKHGDGYFMQNNMATFRVHQSALSSGLSRWQWLRNHVIMFDYLFKYNDKDSFLLKISRKYCLSLYIYNLRKTDSESHEFKPLHEYFKRRPGFAEGISTIFIRIPFYIIRHGILTRLKFLF